MSKYTKIFITLIVVLSLIGIVSIKGDLKKQPETGFSISKNTALDSYEESISNGRKPTMIVFSYDADCCPATKEFFDDYNKRIKMIAQEYKDDLNFIFINTGIIDENEKKKILKIANQYGVEYLPSIVLLSSQGELFKIIANNFDEQELYSMIKKYTKND